MVASYNIKVRMCGWYLLFDDSGGVVVVVLVVALGVRLRLGTVRGRGRHATHLRGRERRGPDHNILLN